MPEATFRPSTEQAKAALRPALTLLSDHRDLLTPALEAALKELHDRLSEQLCPYPTAQLEASKKRLNEKYPDYEHWYIRSGTTITWSARKKAPPPT